MSGKSLTIKNSPLSPEVASPHLPSGSAVRNRREPPFGFATLPSTQSAKTASGLTRTATASPRHSYRNYLGGYDITLSNLVHLFMPG